MNDTKKRWQKLAGIVTEEKTSKRKPLNQIIKESLYSKLNEEEEEEDEITDEDLENEEGDLDLGTDEEGNEIDLSGVDVESEDPIEGIQDKLMGAQKLAKSLNDETLINQIGNTITYFTRNHISKIADDEGTI